MVHVKCQNCPRASTLCITIYVCLALFLLSFPYMGREVTTLANPTNKSIPLFAKLVRHTYIGLPHLTQVSERFILTKISTIL
jgi:hypothetical protein